MPDVDMCVRLCENALVEGLELNSSLISELDQGQRVHLFRNKRLDFIQNTLRNSKRVIEQKILDSFYSDVKIKEIKLQKGSNNNKEGADLFHILPNGDIVEIEVKFGQATDKNIGMEQFKNIFGSSVFQDNLNLDTRKKLFSKFLEHNNESIHNKNLFNILNDSIQKFNQHLEDINYKLDSTKQNYMENLIINNSGSDERTYNHFLKFIIKGDSMRDVDNLPTGIGSWLIDKVNFIDSNIRRVNVFVKNHETKIMIKYVLNWKNNYKYNGISYSAKLGFGTPNWNVWIKVEISLFD